MVERVKGIEPSYSAWKAAALPLSYTRLATAYSPPAALKREQNAASISIQTIVASAAMLGHGAALLNPEFFELEIAAGRLVAPWPTLSENGNGYWLAYPESRRNVPKIKAFRDWIVDEIKDARPRRES